MRIGQLSEQFFVSGQIEPEHVAKLAEQGFKTIVNNRPDGEELGQPTSAEIEAAATAHGLDYVYLPVPSGAVTLQNVEDFSKIWTDLKAPVLLYCRSGARCSMLWQLACEQ